MVDIVVLNARFGTEQVQHVVKFRSDWAFELPLQILKLIFKEQPGWNGSKNWVIYKDSA